MPNDLDALVAELARAIARAVARCVVDDVDPVDEVGDAAQRLDDEALLVVRGHHDGDPLPLEHQPSLVSGRRRARTRLRHECRHEADHEPDQRADEERRPARARGRLHGAGLLDDAARLDALREVQQLAGLEEVLLESRAPRVGSRDDRVQVLTQQQPLDGSDRGVVEQRVLLPLGLLDARLDGGELRRR